MNIKKTVIIFGASMVMLGGAIALSMWLTKDREVAMEVSNPKDNPNGEQTKVFGATDMMPLYYDDEDLLLLPLRSVVQGLGGTVDWDAATKYVAVNYRGRRLQLSTGSQVAMLNGYEIELPKAPETINGTLYVDGDILSEFFVTEVVWNNENKQISMKTMANGGPVVATSVLRGEMNGKSYELDVPVIMGLNDVSYEKSLNNEIRFEMEQLGAAFLGIATEPLEPGAEEAVTEPPVATADEPAIPPVAALEAPVKEAPQGEEITETFLLEMEKGLLTTEFLSLCWRGTLGEEEILRTINIDLRGQKMVSFSDLMTPEGITALTQEEPMIDITSFFITARKELALFVKEDGHTRTVLYPTDGALVGGQWNGKYKSIF